MIRSVQRLVDYLRDQELTVYFDQTHNKASGDISEFTKKALTSTYVVVVGTQDLRIKSTQEGHIVNDELKIIFDRDPRVVFPVLFQGTMDDAFPDHFKGYAKTNLSTFSDWTTGLEAIVQKMNDLAAESYQPAKKKRRLTAQIQVPTQKSFANFPEYSDVSFVGRQKECERIHDLFHRDPDPLTVITISGLEGIGKSDLAMRYTYIHQDEYAYICWLDASSQTNILSGLRVMLNELIDPDWPQIDLDRLYKTRDIQRVARLVFDKLAEAVGKPCLFIVDNLSNNIALEDYFLVKPAFRFLITCPIHGPGYQVELKPLSAEESVTCLQTQLQDMTDFEFDPGVAAQLVGRLGYLPGALVQAARYIRAVPETLHGYLRLFEDQPVETLGEEIETTSLSVRQCLEIAINRLKASPADLPEDTFNVLRYVAFLGDADIEKPWLLRHLSQTGTNQVVRILRQYSLAWVSAERIRFSTLLSVILRHQMKGVHTYRPRLHDTLDWMQYEWRFDARDPSTWEKCAQLADHVVVVCNHALAEHVCINTCWILLHEVAQYHICHSGQIETALKLLEKIILSAPDDGSGSRLSSGHIVDMAVVILDLAHATQSERNVTEIDVQQYQGKPVVYARMLHRAGQIEKHRGNPLVAKERFEESLRVIGPDVSRVTSGYQYLLNLLGLGQAFHDLGATHYADAKAKLEEAEQVAKKTVAPWHPLIAFIYHAQGRLCLDQGDPESAIQYFQSSLQIKKELYGDSHPYVSASKYHLARAYQVQGVLDQAMPLLKEVLRSRRFELGEDHPKTGDAFFDLGCVGAQIDLQANLDLVRDCYAQAHRIYLQFYGDDGEKTKIVSQAIASIAPQTPA